MTLVPSPNITGIEGQIVNFSCLSPGGYPRATSFTLTILETPMVEVSCVVFQWNKNICSVSFKDFVFCKEVVLNFAKITWFVFVILGDDFWWQVDILSDDSHWPKFGSCQGESRWTFLALCFLCLSKPPWYLHLHWMLCLCSLVWNRQSQITTGY